ncbi:hypothetical protein FPQ18DRAFT_418999 [Pyronema domesticum]|nr:hypothetical protein FPQ18DRAFT_418999 [Pyronema domesticum]
MSTENTYEQSVDCSTQASTPGSETPSTSKIMSTTSTVELQITSPTYENIFTGFHDGFASLRAEMAGLETENKRLVEHNTVEKELETLKEENAKLSEAKDNAMKTLAEVNEKNAGLDKEFTGLEGLKEVLGWKKRCDELENRAVENQEKVEKLLENYQRKTEKLFADCQAKMEQMQLESCTMWSIVQENLKAGYIFREKPLKIIPHGMVQVNRAELDDHDKDLFDSLRLRAPPHEDEDSCAESAMVERAMSAKNEMMEKAWGSLPGSLRGVNPAKSKDGKSMVNGLVRAGGAFLGRVGK